MWNATIEARDGTEYGRKLADLAVDLAVENAPEIVLEIGRRKFARFGGDRRRVAAVRVVMRDGRATVEVASVRVVRGVAR